MKNKGSILPVLILVGFGVSAGILYYFTRVNMQKQIQVKQRVDSELDEAFLKVSSLLVSPANCNATFYQNPVGFSLSGNLPSVKKCSDGQNCRPGTPLDSTQVEYNVLESSWNPSDTKLTHHLRIGKANYQIIHTQNGDNNDPSILKIDFEFQKHYGNTSRVIKILKSVELPVVLNDDLDKIIGCPKSPNTITVY